MNMKIILAGIVIVFAIIIAGSIYYMITKVEIEELPQYVEQYDINKDGKIDESDADLIKLDYGWMGNPGAIRSDLNKDGKVDYLDISILVNYIGAIEQAETFEPQ